MGVTPNDIATLLHYHTSPCPHPRAGARAVIETTERFVRDGIIELVKGEYYTTKRGQAWVRMILKTPYPTEAWVDAEGEKV